MSTSIYRKPTFIGFYFSFFDSRHPGIIKKMQDTLTTRSSNIQMEWPRHSPRRDVQNKVGRRLEKKKQWFGSLQVVISILMSKRTEDIKRLKIFVRCKETDIYESEDWDHRVATIFCPEGFFHAWNRILIN